MDGIKSNTMVNLASFLLEEDVQIIINTALRAVNLRNKVSNNDFANSFLLWSREHKWFEHINQPEAIYAYFKKTIRSLIVNQRFLQESFGINPFVEDQYDSLAINNEGRTKLENIPAEEESESSGDIAERKVALFIEIIGIVAEKNQKFGELLERHYLNGEPAESIAKDFLERKFIIPHGYVSGDSFSEEQIKAATLNVQNALLPRARDRFNEVALDRGSGLRLKGKIKKSIIRNRKGK